MPGWYEQLEPYFASGQLQPIGVIQEQHPARTVLFNQWKGLRMTMLVDPLNALDVTAVPIVLLVDANGVIRYRRPTMPQVREFLAQPATEPTVRPRLPGEQWAEGDRAALQGELATAEQYYLTALDQRSDDARLNFRLGVVNRMKYDAAGGKPNDFKTAVDYWKRALSLNPNQYIWRRRIQQYGPILDKPYPFYDWVARAREEIIARGDEPHALTVEPKGAELAGPRTQVDLPADKPISPDPEARIARDSEKAVLVDTIVVPATDRDQPAVRVHLSFQPNHERGYAWNNEAEPVTIWIDDVQGLRVSEQLFHLPGPPAATSGERRQADFEIRWTRTNSPPTALSGYALYHVCEKKTGICIYRRQDLTIQWAD